MIYSTLPIVVNNALEGQAGSEVEYYYEDKTDILLDRGAFLQEGDRISFDLQIPNKNVTTMDGIISVEGRDYLNFEFQNSAGELYCDQCKMRIYGDQSGEKISDIQDAVRINVNKGDFIRLVITSPEDARLQTVHIKLQVSYLEQHQRIVAPVLDNNTTTS